MAAVTAARHASRLPDFLGVGPPRTATSWLDAILRGHAAMPRDIKEVDFFVKNYARGIEWYKSYFRDADPSMPAGEICPSYFGPPEARERVKLHLPNCKIICTIRDPVESLYSGYRLSLRNVWTRTDIESFAASQWSTAGRASALRAWREMFGPDQVLACIYDDLEADPQSYLNPICDFIGIKRIDLMGHELAARRVNTFRQLPKSQWLARKARKLRDRLMKREAYGMVDLLRRAGVWRFCFERGEELPPLSPAVEQRLRDRCKPDIEELERLLGRDLSRWKQPSAERVRSADIAAPA
ncbi:MAG TPA: sulfotransferase [Candidatus Binataceae bacterium]|nr:sulfotransferase [Candidatus Binataceae bacterium]